MDELNATLVNNTYPLLMGQALAERHELYYDVAQGLGVFSGGVVTLFAAITLYKTKKVSGVGDRISLLMLIAGMLQLIRAIDPMNLGNKISSYQVSLVLLWINSMLCTNAQ